MVIYAVITAKDEGESIGRLVRTLRAMCFGVIVVDDGSLDATGIIAEDAGALVLRHRPSQGIGKSLMEAWRAALVCGAERIVQLDAGGSHDPLDAARLLDVQADVVVGSRFCKGGQYYGRSWRAFLSRAAAGLCNFAAHGRVSDWTSGYRIFTRRAVERLLEHPYWYNMHAWQMEVLGRAYRDKLTVKEGPITYQAGRSSLRWGTVSDAIGVWLWLLFN